MQLYRNSNSVMEPETIQKNGSTPKKQRRRGNLICFLMVLCFCAYTNKAMGAVINYGRDVCSDGGSSGNNYVTAELDTSTGILKIIGTGNMADFDASSTGVPWVNYRSQITTVEISNGVKNIGNVAFQNCNNLLWITIPEGVTIIGMRAFENCTSLTAFHIPSSVAVVESWAFKGCSALTTIWNRAIIPQTIDITVFEGVSLNGKYLAVAAESIDAYKLKNIWNNFTVAPQSMLIKFDDNDEYNSLVFDLDGHLQYYKFQDNNPNILKKLVVFDGETYIDETQIPSLVVDCDSEGKPYRYMASDGTKILVDGYENNTFNATLVTTSGERFSVENISYSISDITYDLSIEKYITDVTDKMWKATLHKFMEGGTLNAEEIVTKAFKDAFLKTVFEDESMPDVIKVGYTVLTFVKSAKNTAISCGFANSTSPFLSLIPGVGWAAALAVYIPCVYDIIKMAEKSTKVASSLYDMFNNKSNTNCSVFADLTGTTLTIYGNGALCTEELNKYADRKDEIKALVIGSGVTSIPSGAFADCTNLTDVTMQEGTQPLSVAFSSVYLGTTNSFSGCPIATLRIGRNLTAASAYVSNGNKGLFQNKTTLISVTIDEGVTSIPAETFSGCTKLTNVIIPESITEIESETFYQCTALANINISNSITAIKSYAFAETALNSITIPNSIMSITSGAFAGCTKLTDVTMQNGTQPLSVTFTSFYLGTTNAFADCPIATLRIGRNLTAASAYVSNGNKGLFQNKTTLISVTIDEGVTSIPSETFSGCIALSAVHNKSTTPQSISANVFSGVNMQNSTLYVPADCLSAYRSAAVWKDFGNIVEETTTATATENSAVITWNPVSNAVSYTLTVYTDEARTQQFGSYTIPATAQSSALRSAQQVMSYTVTGLSPNTLYYYTLAAIGANSETLMEYDGGFITQSTTPCSTPTAQGTTGTLTWKLCPDSTLTIGGTGAMPDYEWAVDGTPWSNYRNNITRVVIQDGVTSIGMSAFGTCSGLTSVTIPTGVTSIGMFAFAFCTELTSVTIPASVTNIDLYAFQDCSGLKSITNLATTPQSIAEAGNVFYNVNITACTLNVPICAVAAYQAANGWKEFANIVGEGTCAPPTVTTNVATNVTQTTATLNKTVTAGTETITSQGFKYKKTSESTWSTSATGNLTGLSVNTQYDFYAFATTASGTFEGNTLQFTTLDNTPPTVVTNSATNVTQTTATLNKTVTAGTETITSQGFKYKKTSESTWLTSANGNLTGLSVNTQYDFYAFATTASGTFEGNTLQFTTLAHTPPTVVSNAATNVTQTAATLNKTVTAGTETITSQGFKYKKTSENTWSTSTNGYLTGLSVNTQYDFYAFATTASRTFEGKTLQFTTECLNYNVSQTVSVCSGESYTFPDGTTIRNITAQTQHTSRLTTRFTNCDSVIVTTVHVKSADVSITLTGQTLTANQPGAVYQWLDCDNNNAPIAYAVAQSFTPAVSGHYAVKISYDGCMFVSECTEVRLPTTIDRTDADNKLVLFPNPVRTILYIGGTEEITNAKIVDVNGGLVKAVSVSDNQINVSDLYKGLYLIILQTKSGEIKAKFVKE